MHIPCANVCPSHPSLWPILFILQSSPRMDFCVEQGGNEIRCVFGFAESCCMRGIKDSLSGTAETNHPKNSIPWCLISKNGWCRPYSGMCWVKWPIGEVLDPSQLQQSSCWMVLWIDVAYSGTWDSRFSCKMQDTKHILPPYNLIMTASGFFVDNYCKKTNVN